MCHLMNYIKLIDIALYRISTILLFRVQSKTPLYDCVPVDSPGYVFGFINITNLLLVNVHFDGCGGVIPSTAVTSFNNTHPQLLYKQRAVLMFNLCNNVTIRQVNIDNMYFGYAILILNPFGIFEVLSTTVSEGLGGIPCSDDTTSCPGSGIAAIFKNRGKSADNENKCSSDIKRNKSSRKL